jgi:hypothetical protein
MEILIWTGMFSKQQWKNRLNFLSPENITVDAHFADLGISIATAV